MSIGGSALGGIDPRSVVRAEPMEFSFNANANSGDNFNKEVMFDGKIIEMYIGAAAALNNEVGIRIDYDGKQRVPGNREDDYIYPANVSRGWPVVFDVQEDEDITLTYENFSGSAHYANVMLMLMQFESTPDSDAGGGAGAGAGAGAGGGR